MHFKCRCFGIITALVSSFECIILSAPCGRTVGWDCIAGFSCLGGVVGAPLGCEQGSIGPGEETVWPFRGDGDCPLSKDCQLHCLQSFTGHLGLVLVFMPDRALRKGFCLARVFASINKQNFHFGRETRLLFYEVLRLS